MFSLLLNLYGEVSVQQQSCFYSSVSKDGKTVGNSEHHESGYRKDGSDVKAHQTDRNTRFQNLNGFNEEWNSLNQQTGRTRGGNTTTRTRKAEGYEVKPSGQPGTGQLTVTDVSNAPISVAGLDFDPNGPSQVKTEQISCQGGHCKIVR